MQSIESIKHHIPGWELRRIVGKGSSATVYEVSKMDALGGETKAALKVISIPTDTSDIQALRDEGLDDASISDTYRSQMELIARELRLMSTLKGNSNIVSYEDHALIEHEADPGWDILIRMELLSPLPEYYRTNFADAPIDDATVARIGIDICKALEICEKNNIIHRDIKPQNIFVSPNGDFKLGDFGIAVVSDHTTKATKAGTYSFMAPELYNNRPLNNQADQYSLGLVLYWLLNERRGPFLPSVMEMKAPTASQNSQALARRMDGEPLPEPMHGSKALQAVVMKACSFNPDDRFPNPLAMREALEHIGYEDKDTLHLNCGESGNEQANEQEAPRRGADEHKNRWLPIVAAAAAVVALIAGGFFAVSSRSVPKPTDNIPEGLISAQNPQTLKPEIAEPVVTAKKDDDTKPEPYVASECFADAEQITNKEAVEVIAQLSLIPKVAGEENKFYPAKTFTREEAARVMSYLLLPSHAANALNRWYWAASAGPFEDVDNWRWSAGAIAYCKDVNIVSGVGDGRFDPTGDVTGTQFLKMLLVSLGYDPSVEGLDGDDWEERTILLASQYAEITKGMENSKLNKPLSREDAALLIFNALTSTVQEYNGNSRVDVINGSDNDYRTSSADQDAKQQLCEKQFPGLKFDSANGTWMSARNALAISDAWNEFIFALDGDVYTLPIPYEEFTKNGWTNLPGEEKKEIEPGFVHLMRLERNGHYIDAELWNLSGSCKLAKDCEIKKITMTDSCGTNIQMSRGVSMSSTKRPTAEDIITAYGEPSNSNIFGDLVYVSTVTIGSDSFNTGAKMSFAVDSATQRISEIILENISQSAAETEVGAEERPAFLDEYTAPTALENSCKIPVFELNGKIYRLPCPVTEFINDGWKISEDMTGDLGAKGSGSVLYPKLELCKDGMTLIVNITNPSRYTQKSINCVISKIDFFYPIYSGAMLPLRFPCELSVDSSVKELDDALKGFTKSSGYGDSIVYTYEEGAIKIEVEYDNTHGKASWMISNDSWDY